LRRSLNKSLTTASVISITVLLLLNIGGTLYNNKIIEENRNLQRQAEEIKVTISQFAIIIIHNHDLALRGYALYRKEKYLYPLKFALHDKDSLMNAVERSLVQQHYPTAEFSQLRDSINAFSALTLNMLKLIDANDMAEFNRLSDLDQGYHLWLQYERFARKVYQFENDINEDAQRRYHLALRNNFLLQVFLLLLCVPTLVFTAIHTYKKFVFEVKLKEAEAEKAILLSSQNKMLEQIVQERTREIESKNQALQAQYEEITTQNEEITAQNEELTGHRETLALQNEALSESKKLQLELYTQNLMEKSDMISRISNELEELKSKLSAGQEQEQIQKFSSILQFSILTDEDWERFKKTFQEVYPNFFASLRYRFYSITASELRLSALIKMNLSLKESANMLGISTDSVKKSRYRLKKRLGLLDEESLEEFIRKLD